MPTGFTYPVQEGKCSFNEFVWNCVRAFDVAYHLRDQPNAPIPLTCEPRLDYYVERLNEETERLKKFLESSEEDLRKEYEAGLVRTKNFYEQTETEREVQNSRFRAMLDKVEAWEPPTPDHEKLKTFMREQLTTSFYSAWELPSRPSFEDWKKSQIANANRMIKSWQKDIETEIKRAKFTTDYLQALNKSVPQPEHIKAK